MRRCRYRLCGQPFTPAKPYHWFCCWAHCEAHYRDRESRGDQRSRKQSYDRGWNDAGRSKPPTTTMMPPHIWRALAVLVHPDRWQQAPGLLALSHEATVWLNAHRPSNTERS
jgi:hypothetical protein